MAEELSVKIKADSTKLIEELKKVGVAVDALNKQSSKIVIDTNASDVIKSIKDINTQLNKLTGKQAIQITLSASNVLQRLQAISNAISDIKSNRSINITLGQGTRLTSTLSTLKDVRNIVNSINKKSLSIDGSIKVGGVGKAISQYDRVATKLSNIKESSKVSIVYESTGFSTAFVQLKAIDNLLKQINKNRIISSSVKVNTKMSSTGSSASTIRSSGNSSVGGSSRQTAMGDSAYGLTSTDTIGYIGRISKGWGSALEVVSRLLYKAQQVPGAIGETATMAAKLTAVFAVLLLGGKLAFDGIIAGVNLATNVLQTFGNILVTALTPGWQTLKTTQQGVLSLSAALQSMGQIDNGPVSAFQAQTAAINLMNQAMFRAQQSAFSYKEVVDALQGVLPMALGKGMNAQDALNVTTGVAGVAKLTGLGQNQVLQETRDLFQGSITKGHSQVANALGITNEDITKYEGDADGLVKFLTDKFSKYNDALKEYSNTPQGAIEQLQETLGIAGQSILDSFGGVIVELAQSATSLFGTFIDGSGKWVNANNEVVDSEGNVLGKVEELRGTIQAFDETTTHFKLSDTLNDLVAMLVDVGAYIAMCVDQIYNWAEANGYIDDDKTIFENLGSLIKTCIGFLVDVTMAAIDFGTSFVEWGTKAYNICYVVIGAVKELASLIASTVNGLASLAGAAGAIQQGNFSRVSQINDAANKFSENESNYRRKVSEEVSRRLSDINTPVFDNRVSASREGGALDWYNKTMGGSTKYQSLADWQNKMAGGTSPSSIKGDTELGKAAKEQVKASQKAMQDQVQILKDNLADQLDVFKRAMEGIEVAFKDNAMSIDEYFKAKTANEQAQNQAKIDELSAEREVIQNTLYANEDDRNKALSKVDRQLSIYTRNMGEIAKSMEEISQMQAEYLESIKSSNTQSSSGTLQGATQEEQALYNAFNTYKSQDTTGQLTYADLLAIAQQESSGAHYNEDGTVKESPDHGIGLMQLTSEHARSLADNANPYDLQSNANGGTQFFIELLNEYRDLRTAFARYNGSGPESEAYADTVMQGMSDITPHANDLMASAVSGINAGLNAGFDKWNGQVMDNAEQGCVEAVTKIGDSFSKFLGNELSKGVVDVQSLQADAKSAGVPEIPYDQSQIKAGDVVVFDSGEHVLIYKGQEKYVGNSFKKNKVMEQNASTYPMTPTSIIQTGSYGIDGTGLGISTKATTKTSLEYKEKLREEALNRLKITQQVQDIYGQGASTESLILMMDYRKKIEHAMAEHDTESVAKLKILLDEAIRGIDVKNIKKNLDLSVKDMQLSAETMGYKIGLGLEDASKAVEKYSNYVTEDFHIDSAGNKITNNIHTYLQGLRALMAQYETKGSLQGYYDIKSAIDKVYTDLDNIFKSFLQRVDDLASFKTSMIDNNQLMTESEKTKAKKDMTRQKVLADTAIQQAELDRKIAELQDLLNSYNIKSAQFSTMPESPQKNVLKSELSDTKLSINKIQFGDIPALQQAIQLNKQLSIMPTLMEKVGVASRQAFEDGLNTFLTDGINNANSLSEAFNNMIVSILKEIQKVFAQSLTKSIMGKIFPTKDMFSSDKKTSTYDLSQSPELSFNPSQTESVTDYNPFSDKKSSMYKNLDFKGTDATKLTSSMTNLQSSYFSALTTMDSTVAGLVARINNSANKVNNLVASLSTSGIATTDVSTGSAAPASNDYSFDFKGLKYATGGIVSGAGTGTSDSIDAKLSNGEGIITAQRVKQLGTNFIHAVNRGDFSAIHARLPKFAEGGVVGDTGAQTTARGIASFADNVGTKVSTTNNMSIAMVRDEAEAMSHFMKSGKGERILLDFNRKNAQFVSRVTR